MSNVTILEFTENCSPYAEGDIAGFENEAEAEKFVEAGVAKRQKSKPEEKKEPETKEPETKDVEGPEVNKMVGEAPEKK